MDSSFLRHLLHLIVDSFQENHEIDNISWVSDQVRIQHNWPEWVVTVNVQPSNIRCVMEIKIPGGSTKVTAYMNFEYADPSFSPYTVREKLIKRIDEAFKGDYRGCWVQRNGSAYQVPRSSGSKSSTE